MGLTYSVVGKMNAGNFRTRVVDITADSTYTTSGYALTTADYSSLIGGPLETTTTSADSRIILFDVVPNITDTTAIYDSTNRKLLFFVGASEATTTISSKTVRCQIWHDPVNHK